MSKGRPRFRFFIFDCPSGHEIDSSLPTESDVIRAVLANKNHASKLKTIKCSTAGSFRSMGKRQYTGVKYVHIGGHGSEHGLGFIGGWVEWADVAKTLVALFPELDKNEQRVLTLSCCFSRQGIVAMKPKLQGHFSAAYHFVPSNPDFSEAITTWSMFYQKRKRDHPSHTMTKRINDFMGADILGHVPITRSDRNSH